MNLPLRLGTRLLGRDLPIPTPVGLERGGEVLIRPYCPPYYPSMREAVLAFVDSKYGEHGTFRAADSTGAWRDPAAVRAGHRAVLGHGDRDDDRILHVRLRAVRPLPGGERAVPDDARLSGLAASTPTSTSDSTSRVCCRQTRVEPVRRTGKDGARTPDGRSRLGKVPACAACGHQNRAGARFCDACGAPLAEPAPAGEQRKTVTVLFSDVTGSTALGERLDPESLRAVMARYFDLARTVVERHGGTVEKFIGDAVMAVFGVPVLHEDDALRAVRAAADLRTGLAELNGSLERDYGTKLELRIGVNTARAHRQQHALDDQLTCDARASGAQRQPRRQLLDSCAGPHQHEIRHVDDADQQDEQRTAPHQIEDRFHVADEKILQRRDDRVEARVGEELGVLRKALEVSGVDRVDLLLRLLHRRAGLEASDVSPVVAVALLVALLLRGKRRRQPEQHLGLREREVPGITPTTA